MFRMPRDSFMTLVETIEESVGKGVFKSELWLEERKGPITHAATGAIGGFVCGEIKLALTLRMLAGASYLDLLNQYGVSSRALYEYFYEVIKWIVETFDFPLHGWLENEDWDSLE